MIAIVNRISDNDFDYYKAKIDECNGYWVKLDEDNPEYERVLSKVGGVLITGA